PALAVAPWVFVRGNHEDCNRAWEGFFRFLDFRPFTGVCPAYSDPVSIPIGGLRLVIMDDSAANDVFVDLAQVDQYTPQFDMARGQVTPNPGLLMPRPLWAFGVFETLGQTPVTNVPLQAASQNSLPAGVDLVLSGHGHFFEAVNFVQDRAPQLI